MANDDRNSVYHSSPPTLWNQFPAHPHSHHGTPAQEYAGFNFTSPQLPMASNAYATTTPTTATSIQSRPLHSQLQPLIMPQWPSMLNSQPHSNYQSMFPQSAQPMQPMSMAGLQTPVSATSARSVSTPRKTLTDLDRKRMCQYAEEHPNSKQTEIGAIFGVERSTVSKVLRQKEKYLFQDDGSKSPIKRAKGRSPDIERALAVWAKNQEKKGNPLTDDLIRAQARAFASTTTSPDNHQTLSSSWIEKFKLKNNLMGARSRKTSHIPEDVEHTAAASSSSHTPVELSPISPSGLGSPSPGDLHTVPSHESLKDESPDGYIDFGPRNGSFHTQSTISLSSAFTETEQSSFSPGPLSPTSPLFTPDSGPAPSLFVPPQAARPHLPKSASEDSRRPRSQAFPLLDQYMTSSGNPGTPKYTTHAALDSPMEEPSDAWVSSDDTMKAHESEGMDAALTPSETMRPPPLPAHGSHSDGTKRESTSATAPLALFNQATTPEEARRALQVVLTFFEQQPSGFLNFESMTMGKLMEKLKFPSHGNS